MLTYWTQENKWTHLFSWKIFFKRTFSVMENNFLHIEHTLIWTYCQCKFLLVVDWLTKLYWCAAFSYFKFWIMFMFPVQFQIQLRHKLARLLGFANYADYATDDRMAKSSSKVGANFIGDWHSLQNMENCPKEEYTLLLAPVRNVCLSYLYSFTSVKKKRENTAWLFPHASGI